MMILSQKPELAAGELSQKNETEEYDTETIGVKSCHRYKRCLQRDALFLSEYDFLNVLLHNYDDVSKKSNEHRTTSRGGFEPTLSHRIAWYTLHDFDLMRKLVLRQPRLEKLTHS